MTTGALFGIGMGLNIIGTVSRAGQAVKEGKIANQIAQRNATIAEQNAELAISQAKSEEARTRERFERLKGAQRTGFAASGVEIGTGSPLLVLANTAREEELEALSIRQRGEIERTSFENQAEGLKFEGEQAESAGKKAAFNTILSGAGRTLTSFSKAKKTGVFG